MRARVTKAATMLLTNRLRNRDEINTLIINIFKEDEQWLRNKNKLPKN